MSREKTVTVNQLKTAIRNQIWASGEPENLVSAHDLHFQEAFGEIANYVLCERDDNVNVVRFKSTFYKDGMTVLPMPPGRVRRVFTVANEDFSDPVYYYSRSWPEPLAWSRNLYLFPKQDLTKAGKLLMGFNYPDPNNDSLYGRARTGVWAQYQKNLYLAPWIQSNELIVIEWSGIKLQWMEEDLVNPTINYRTAVKLFVQYAHERDYGQADRAVMFHNPTNARGLYDEALGTLIWECREKQREYNEFPERHERNRLCSEISDDFPIIGLDSGVMLALIGNGSQPGDDLDRVGKIMRGWGPNAIVASGFIIPGTQLSYDATAGDQFHDFINPYAGAQGAGANTNAFWTVPAASDWTLDSLVSYFKFFPAPAPYYDVVIGDVHLFVLDTSNSDPGGITAVGTQGSWLQGRLATSTAPWKVVVMDQCAYGSVHSNATLQWPFQTWGASLVISSQAANYERLNISSLPVINNGLGGGVAIEEVANPSTNTLASYSEKFGAGRLFAKATNLVFEFWNEDGKLIDTLELTK